MEYYSAIKKNEIMPFATTWMDLEIIILSKVSQKKKDKFYMISLICGIKNMTQMNLSTKQTHRHSEQTCGCPGGWGQGGGMDWELGISRCKLLYIEWINSKVLLYSTGNYIQYPVINHNRKEYIYMCITESLCCTAEINTTL